MIVTVLSILAAVVAVLWALTPFAVFGLRTRLAAVEDSYRRHTEEIGGELHKLNTLLAAEGHRILVDPMRNDATLLVRNASGRA